MRCARPLLVTGLAVLAGCAPFRPQPQVTVPEVKPLPPEAARPAPVRRSSKPLPIPERPLMVSTDCNYRDDIGTEGRLVLDVHESTVRRFSSAVDMGRRGNCRFDLSAFRQTAFTPMPTLVAGACTVSMWEQGDEVTVSYRNCASQCSPGAHEYLWPTLVSRRTGACR
ncbi:MAG: hypothetical protein KBF58_07740 [Methyloversatilis sp.]|nr:hypothetical protein [Methyloversatilis sp.]MBP6193659.1 hypothetical protein [Methyloversatilis sp.]MBP9117955.1 hypothetical protein [Methyloversatilis sp.]